MMTEECDDLLAMDCRTVQDEVGELVPECHTEETIVVDMVTNTTCTEVIKQECEKVPEKNCKDVTTHQCSTSLDREYKSVDKELCNKQPQQECKDFEVEDCTTVTSRECVYVQNNPHHTVPSRKWSKVLQTQQLDKTETPSNINPGAA